MIRGVVGFRRYNLLDARLTSILQTCHDQVLLDSVQSIIHNMIACEDTSQDHLYYVHTCGFGGLWRFAGPFNKVKISLFFYLMFSIQSQFIIIIFFFFLLLRNNMIFIVEIFLQSNPTVLGTEMFANYLEAIVETILPAEEGETGLSDASTTVSLVTLGSPIDKGKYRYCNR